MSSVSPFNQLLSFKNRYDCDWKAFEQSVSNACSSESKILEVIKDIKIPDDSVLVLFGSFARYEMLETSDHDWALLVDGKNREDHPAEYTSECINKAFIKADLSPPGSGGAFGKPIFSDDLEQQIGGNEDSNKNLTARMLLLLESRAIHPSQNANRSIIWENVIEKVLKRYFEEEVHINNRGVPRFLLNDITRYWRTICVDYAAKHRDQSGHKWALRNAKLRISRKLLYAAGLAFCLSCELDSKINNAEDGVKAAIEFANTPPLEYLAYFIERYIDESRGRKEIVKKIFGSYNRWLSFLSDPGNRARLSSMDSGAAREDPDWQKVREMSSEFAEGLRMLFFNRETDNDPIANLCLDYVGF